MIYFSDFSAGGGGFLTDPPFANVVLLLSQGGSNGATSWTDESTYARTITRVGSTVVSNAKTLFGQNTTRYDGVSDGLEAADAAALEPGSSPFTFETWVNFDSIGTIQMLAGKRAASGTNSGNGYGFNLLVNNSLELVFWDTGGNQRGIATTASAVTTGQWYHVVFSRNSADKFRIYIDGVMAASGTFSGSSGTIRDTSTVFRLGLMGSTAFDFTGHMAETRFTIGVCLYDSDSNFTPPVAAFPRS